MVRKKTPAEADAAAEPVSVSIKFTHAQHRRAKLHAMDYRGRMLAALVHAAVEYVLDEVDAGRTPKGFAAKMVAAQAAQQAKGGGA